MQQQGQLFGVASQRSFIGPFLRFGSGTGPGDENRWAGSALVLTKGGAAVAAGQGKADAPVLYLYDKQSSGNGEAKEQQLVPVELDSCLGWVFWRFELHLTLTEWQRAVHYRVEAGGATTQTFSFWLPGLGQPMHWAYTSCAGMSVDVAPSAPELQDPTYLWRDLLQVHSAFPMHCLVGGGDQLYNDAVWQCPTLKAWGASRDLAGKTAAPWAPEMEAEATAFYLSNYIDCFSTPDVDLALAQIPQANQMDDHDYWDGYGSYEPNMQNCPVFQGLYQIARRFYLLFQHHTTDAFNQEAQEFLLNDGSNFHFLKYLGPQVALLGIDMRSQRQKHRIIPQSTYDLLKRVVAAIPEGPQHLVVMSGIPVIFPKIPGSESLLSCLGKLTRSMPALNNMARNSGLLDKFEQPEILDDLTDGWVADFIHMLQEFATKKRMRVSIISGDAHVGGVGRFYSRPKIKNIGDDPLFMCQIISSAIVNAPPPHPVTKMLMRTNFAANVDHRTREKLVRAFYPLHPRTDKLIAQRNWCDCTLLTPPYSAPTTLKDPSYGGLRFMLRVEDGYAEEVYTVIVPRHPAAVPLPPPGVPLIVHTRHSLDGEGERKEKRRASRALFQNEERPGATAEDQEQAAQRLAAKEPAKGGTSASPAQGRCDLRAPPTPTPALMAPKKKEETKERPILGRFRTNLKMGIVGLPNVGKSTLFNTLTKLSIPAENFPFCTIDPNNARVTVPDPRFDWLCEKVQPKSTVPAFLEICDIAGLVKGAAEGQGLGNSFLSHISAVDGIFHVCRAFDDADVVHVEDRVDPVEDLDIIHAELRAKDIENCTKIIEGFKKSRQTMTKEQKDELASAEKALAWMEEGKDIRFGDWTMKDTDWLNQVQFLSAKPVVYLVNLSERDYQRKKNKWLVKLFEWVKAHGGDPIIPFSGALESKLLDMPADERENDVQSALPKIVTAGFKAVRLIYYFTAGVQEVRCWQIREHTKAPQAAGAIHSDFERGFICAEVMSFKDMEEHGSEAAVKAAGKWRQEGKTYEVLDGDIIHWKFNVTASGKK
ncbi:Obg-like ATPase 1 [Chlorella vulgaris]